MKKYSFFLILSAFLGALQINCAKTYSLGPLTAGSAPTPTPGPKMVTTLAGSAIASSSDGIGTSASFGGPLGIAVDSSGNVYVADEEAIRKISPGGVVSTLAGNATIGWIDGTGTAASFNEPIGVAADGSGNVYVADTFNNEIRKITSGGVVTTLAGNLAPGLVDGTGTASSFFHPTGIVVDGSGNIFVADFSNSAIRKITPGGVVTTLAGSGSPGYADGTGAAAQFNNPWGLTMDGSGNIFVTDFSNERIRKIAPGGVVTTLAGSGSSGFANGTGTAASFSSPEGIALDASGNIYVADAGNNVIREVTPGGVVTTFAGSTPGFADGALTTALFSYPEGVAVDAAGTFFVLDSGNHRVREIK